MTAPGRPAAPHTLRVLCTDESAAQLFEAWLINQGVDTSGTDGAEALVPWGGDVQFAMSVGTHAHLHGFAPDDLAPVIRQIEALAVSGA